jgi:hypothetical protein
MSGIITSATLFSAGLHALVGVILIAGLEGGVITGDVLIYFAFGMAATAFLVDTIWPRINKNLY